CLLSPPALYSFPTRRSSDLPRNRFLVAGLLSLAHIAIFQDLCWLVSIFHALPKQVQGSHRYGPRWEVPHHAGDWPRGDGSGVRRSEEHTSELQSRENLVCRL